MVLYIVETSKVIPMHRFFLADELEPLADEEWEAANDNDIKSLLT